jgi:hypothetical protein
MPNIAAQGFDLQAAYLTAAGWARNGNTTLSRSYWSGMRDTLAVLLGITTSVPSVTSDDAAADTLFSHRVVPALGAGATVDPVALEAAHRIVHLRQGTTCPADQKAAGQCGLLPDLRAALEAAQAATRSVMT